MFKIQGYREKYIICRFRDLLWSVPTVHMHYLFPIVNCFSLSTVRISFYFVNIQFSFIIDGGGGGGGEGLKNIFRTHRTWEDEVAKKHTHPYKEEKGIQKLAFTYVRTLWKTPHGSISTFLYNVFIQYSLTSF